MSGDDLPTLKKIMRRPDADLRGGLFLGRSRIAAAIVERRSQVAGIKLRTVFAAMYIYDPRRRVR